MVGMVKLISVVMPCVLHAVYRGNLRAAVEGSVNASNGFLS